MGTSENTSLLKQTAGRKSSKDREVSRYPRYPIISVKKVEVASPLMGSRNFEWEIYYTDGSSVKKITINFLATNQRIKNEIKLEKLAIQLGLDETQIDMSDTIMRFYMIKEIGGQVYLVLKPKHELIT